MNTRKIILDHDAYLIVIPLGLPPAKITVTVTVPSGRLKVIGGCIHGGIRVLRVLVLEGVHAVLLQDLLGTPAKIVCKKKQRQNLHKTHGTHTSTIANITKIQLATTSAPGFPNLLGRNALVTMTVGAVKFEIAHLLPQQETHRVDTACCF